MSVSESYPNILAALCVWREARGECKEARRGVLHTILNRASRKYFGSDIVSVVLYPMQFSSFNRNDPNAYKFPNPKDAIEWKAWLECCAIVDSPGDDPTLGAVLYESIPNPDQRPPWAIPARQTVSIGNFRFYRT